MRPNLTPISISGKTTLSQGEWFAGDLFTAADIMMSFPVEAAAARAGAGDKPHIRAWLDRIHARPAYQRGAGAWRTLRLRVRQWLSDRDAAGKGGGDKAKGDNSDKALHVRLL